MQETIKMEKKINDIKTKQYNYITNSNMNIGYIINLIENNFHNFQHFKFENDKVFINIDNEIYTFDLKDNNNIGFSDYDTYNYSIKQLSNNSFICSQ